MNGFDEWATVQRLHDGTGRFMLMRDLMYRSSGGSVYIVPKGFKTDLASIPRAVWNIFPPHDLYLSASVLHDHFCESDWISRKDGDKLFLEAMLYSHVSKWKALVVYLSVRVYAVLWRK